MCSLARNSVLTQNNDGSFCIMNQRLYNYSKLKLLNVSLVNTCFNTALDKISYYYNTRIQVI
jgi:hypothetical protein